MIDMKSRIHTGELYFPGDKEIPSNVVAVGNPCRIMREISEHDRKYYFKDREINHEEWKKL